MKIKIVIKIIPAVISLIKIFFIFKSSIADFLKYSLKISSVDPKITANIPLKIKNENGIKEMLQINSPKHRAKTIETIKICFLLFSPISSPVRLKAKKFCQNAKKIKKLRIISPLKKLTA